MRQIKLFFLLTLLAWMQTATANTGNNLYDGPEKITVFCDSAAIICDSFENYTLGALGPQSPHWDTWDGPSTVSGGPYPAGDTLQTVNGRLYYLLVDGFNLQGDFAEGEFCLRVQRLTPLTYVEEATFERSIRVSPNPTTGITYLRVSLPEAADLTIRVTNTVGQQIMQRVENNIREDNLRIDLSRHARGLYFVELTDGQNRSTRRVVVE